MFWDGERWLSEDLPPRRPQPPHQPRRVRDWLSTGVMLFVFGDCVFPWAVSCSSSPRPSTARQVVGELVVHVYEEGNPKVAYDGDWFARITRTTSAGHARPTSGCQGKPSVPRLGDRWIGPIGPRVDVRASTSTASASRP